MENNQPTIPETNDLPPTVAGQEFQAPEVPVNIPPVENNPPAVPPAPKTKSKLMPILSIVLILVILGVGGLYAYKNFFAKETEATPTPISTPESTPSPATSVEAIITNTGTVSGKLCYPSSFLPPGEIVAKDLDSGKIYTKDYVGSMAGGKSTYTFELPAGTYHLKYQAHASTKDAGIFTSGYFDECAKTMHTNDCTPDSGHINIAVEVEEGEELQNVDLCDFYYNPTQQEFLEKDF